MARNSRALRSGSARADTAEVLTRPARDLLGVTEAAAAALADLGIRTVFDLGASFLFASARTLLSSSDAGPLTNRFGLVAGDLLTDKQSGDSSDHLGDLPIARLRALSPQQAETLRLALDVETIADLANWPPHREAASLVGAFAGATEDADDAQTDALRPRFGEYPTERVYYDTLVMIDAFGDAGPLEDLTGAVSLMPVVAQSGLTRPAVGALLTFEQSWFAQGVTLGHLLHSVSLAPGEATRIAVIDWSRRTTAFAAETIGETEQLDTASTHARALSEVQQAVAEDFQQGGSRSSSSARSSSQSDASSGSSGLLQSLFTSGSASSTTQSAETQAEAESSSWSLGSRSVMGSLTQNVNDRTEQHSSSVRNRRASAVREVSQSEHEQVSTRIVANYNHMHALNIQYYEVVQVYRTEARLHRADRCLFVPLEQLEFSGPSGWAVVERFRGALLRAALAARAQALLADDTSAVEISPTTRLRFPGVRPDLVVGGVLGTRAIARTRADIAERLQSATIKAGTTPADAAGATGTAGTAGTAGAPPESAGAGTAAPVASAVARRLWDADAVARLSRFVDRPVVRPNSDSLFVPDATELIAVSFDQVLVRSVRIDRVGATAGESQTFTVPQDTGLVDVAPGLPFVELDSIAVVKGEDAGLQGTMTLHCAYEGRRFTLPGIFLNLTRTAAPQKVVAFSTDQAERRKELQQHLQNHREYYSRAIFRALDAATITSLLGRYRFNGRPLVEQVEPRPVTVAGNYLVLRAPVADDEDSGVRTQGELRPWSALLRDRGLDPARAFDRRLIPIPTGGVFAEAVLGRANSAEKLDLTRFWHWEDSPIPLQPTEIAAVQTGSRATAEDLKPGQLSSPLLNIVNPTALPEPTAMSAVLNALAAMNFRDMSGLAGTQALVKSGAEGTLAAATDAGKLAAENLKTEAQKAVAMGQIAGDIAKAAIAAQAAKGKGQDQGGKTGVGGISRDGAMINQGRRMDQTTPAAPAPGGQPAEGGSSGAGTGAPGGSGGGTGESGSGAGPRVITAGQHETDAFNNSVFGPLGASGLDAANAVLTSNTDSAQKNTGGGGTPGMPPFPATLPDPLVQGGSAGRNALETAFRDAIVGDGGANKGVLDDPSFSSLPDARRIPIMIVALDGSGMAAGQNELDMYYSASLLKVAPMYAAFQLRTLVNEFAATLPVDSANNATATRNLFARIRREFDDTIARAVPFLAGVTRVLLVPNYEAVFTATRPAGGRFTLDFTTGPHSPNPNDVPSTTFQPNLEDMIVGSHNASAGFCIRSLGYGWINGLLAAAGFFVPTSSPRAPREGLGIWVTGDYGSAQRVEIASVNDAQVVQVTNCYHMAKLFTLLHDKALVRDAASSSAMLDLLARAVTHPHAPTLLPQAVPPPSFTVTHSKIGVGERKFGSCMQSNMDRCTFSEGAIVESGGRKFAVVWQGLEYLKQDPSAWSKGIRRIVTIIEKTIANYRP